MFRSAGGSIRRAVRGQFPYALGSDRRVGTRLERPTSAARLMMPPSVRTPSSANETKRARQLSEIASASNRSSSQPTCPALPPQRNCRLVTATDGESRIAKRRRLFLSPALSERNHRSLACRLITKSWRPALVFVGCPHPGAVLRRGRRPKNASHHDAVLHHVIVVAQPSPETAQGRCELKD